MCVSRFLGLSVVPAYIYGRLWVRVGLGCDVSPFILFGFSFEGQVGCLESRQMGTFIQREGIANKTDLDVAGDGAGALVQNGKLRPVCTSKGAKAKEEEREISVSIGGKRQRRTHNRSIYGK